MVNYDAMDMPETYVPTHMRGAFKRWIEQGIPMGSFGMAVVSNDLKGAVGRADSINKAHILSILCWLHNYAPADCWGCPDAVKDWAARDWKDLI